MSKRKLTNEKLTKTKQIKCDIPKLFKINYTNADNETNDIKRSFVCGWRNREEFLEVYENLFGPSSNIASKQKAYDSILVWKIRMRKQTPATISGTLTILEVILKDNMDKDKDTLKNLRNMYSTALTRFLNHITSVFKKEQQSMYKIAKSIEMDPFVVEMRHLCSHGQATPSIDVFRRSAIYSLDWLKQYFWDNEVKAIKNTNYKDIKLNVQLYKNELVKYLNAYDIATEGIYKECKTVAELENIPLADNDVRLRELKKLATELDETSLEMIIDSILLSTMSRQTDTNNYDLIYMKTFIDILFTRKFFKEFTILKLQNKWDKYKLSPEELYQDLFFFLSIRGYIKITYNRLLEICENDVEEFQRRQIASFWILKIVEGFINFEKFKNKKFRNLNKKTNVMFPKHTVRIPDIYKKKNVKYVACDLENTLLFAHSQYNWETKFTRDYMKQRLNNLNYFTKEAVINSFQLLHPPLEKAKYLLSLDLINCYLNSNTLGSGNKNQCYTLEDVFKCTNGQENGEVNIQNGLWSLAPENVDWASLPLGEII